MRHGLLLFLFALACSGCAATASSQTGAPARPAAINHFVAFKLVNPADADELIADCDAHLRTIPGVVSYFAGRHHETGRASVYREYDVGFFVGFNSDEDYAVYVDHPNHVYVVQKWRPRLEWLRVYDVWDGED
ncbi:MAG TPA: Dabb family protein [Phycisphaerales bacterium]|nr:Dabb family protein [Phycisphaerales bacterium]HRQ75764.1 Dabb family protein [Phycisphaerales bacterium]